MACARLPHPLFITYSAMRDDIPKWIGPPPPRTSSAWKSWLIKWQNYALEHLGDTDALNPEMEFGLLSPSERKARLLAEEVDRQLVAGLSGDEFTLHLDLGDRDLVYAGTQAWLTGKAVFGHIPVHVAQKTDPWLERHATPARIAVAQAIHVGLLVGLRGKPCEEPDGVMASSAYVAAWIVGNAKAIEADPR
jgi:hypothetical protein